MLDYCQVHEHFMANAESQARQKPLQDGKSRQERCTLLAFRNWRGEAGEAGQDVLTYLFQSVGAWVGRHITLEFQATLDFN